jgi:sugar phosphate isomerase/epimerase
LKICFDSGHAHLDGGVNDAVELLGERIASTHLHDNAGTKDEHLLPFEGKIEWGKLLGALRQQSKEIPLVLELRDSESKPVTLQRAAEAAQKLEELWEEAKR